MADSKHAPPGEAAPVYHMGRHKHSACDSVAQRYPGLTGIRLWRQMMDDYELDESVAVN